MFRGKVINFDTGYEIQVGAFGYNDTLTYAQRELRKKGVSVKEAFRRVNALVGIEKLIQNAVLLDAEVIADESNPNRSFMLSFYTVAKVDGVDELIKIKVDQLESPTNPTKRFYNLNDFEIVNKKPLAVNWDLNPSTVANGNKGTAFATISVADLYQLVKQYDSAFKPNVSTDVKNTGKVKFSHMESDNVAVEDGDVKTDVIDSNSKVNLPKKAVGKVNLPSSHKATKEMGAGNYTRVLSDDETFNEMNEEPKGKVKYLSDDDYNDYKNTGNQHTRHKKVIL